MLIDAAGSGGFRREFRQQYLFIGAVFSGRGDLLNKGPGFRGKRKKGMFLNFFFPLIFIDYFKRSTKCTNVIACHSSSHLSLTEG